MVYLEHECQNCQGTGRLTIFYAGKEKVKHATRTCKQCLGTGVSTQKPLETKSIVEAIEETNKEIKKYNKRGKK